MTEILYHKTYSILFAQHQTAIHILYTLTNMDTIDITLVDKYIRYCLYLYIRNNKTQNNNISTYQQTTNFMKMKHLKHSLTCTACLLILSACQENISLTGKWTQPIPGMPASRQGFILNENGKASSVNMATLRYETWEQKGNKLIFSGKSIGNHQIIPFADTLTIEKLTQDTLNLRKGQLLLQYTRDTTPQTSESTETSANSTLQESKIFSVNGILTIGPETRTFTPEGTTDTYWVIDQTGTLYEKYDRVTNGTKNGIPVHARLQVTDAGKTEDGFAKDYQSTYHVHKIDTIYR